MPVLVYCMGIMRRLADLRASFRDADHEAGELAEDVPDEGAHLRRAEQGPSNDPWATSWNSSHQSRSGCRQDALRTTGGDGLLYCFATN
jgi:hypothetical protein